MASKSVTLGPWPKGMNNIKPDYALGKDELRQITNFDVTDEGHLRTRRDKTAVYTGSDVIHSLYGTAFGELLFVEGDTLKLLNPDYTASTLLSNCGRAKRMFYVHPGDGVVRFSNGQVTGSYAEGAVSPWGLPTPTFLPTLTATSGSLYAGQYKVLLTYVDAVGRESGAASLPAFITVADNSGITVALLTSVPSSVIGTNIYVTEANGETYYFQRHVPAGQATHVVGTIASGRRLLTKGLVPFPASQLLQWYKGSVIGARGNLLFFSPPLTYDLFDPAKGYLMFESNIQVIAAMDNGLFVATENETNWIKGDAASGFEREVVLPYGGAFGSLYAMPHNTDVIWFSPKGFIMGNDDGEAKPLHDGAVAVGQVTEAATLVREQNGIRQAVAVPLGKNFDSAFSIGDYAEAEVRRVNTEV